MTNSKQSLSVEELRAATVALIRAAEQDSAADWPQGVDNSHLDRAWEALDATYPVIWTDEQVAGVQAWQECGWVHPLTCANHNDNWHRDEDGEEVLPIALPQGLVCRSCGYRQFQVPPMCFEGSPPNPWETNEDGVASAKPTRWKPLPEPPEDNSNHE
jgi:hypothetical protein